MNTKDDEEDFDFLGPGELEAMEKEWRSGELQPVVERVLRFVENGPYCVDGLTECSFCGQSNLEHDQ
ncbi:MAG: hypothetical protein WC378_00480 [Opitutaceae bacterium]|jgi:hypothetical protein